jgi:predicted Zn-dependent protease
VYVESGILRQLRRTRFWAQKTGKKPTADGGAVRLLGGGKPLEQLIAGVERGLLVTRIWYVRELEPQTIGVTGLTRDATFLIENGRLSRAVRNFRFNQSLIDLLANVEALGREERTPASESPVPPVVVKDFHMSSVSEAI